MSNINPKLQYLFFRRDPRQYPSTPSRHPYFDFWNQTDLICVGYDTISTINGIASITVAPVGSQTRAMCKEVVKGKHAAGKTFEIVTVPHRLKESIILGAKYFLLTRERP